MNEVTKAFKEHYNWERPHQGLSCKNKPPRVAFPTLPALLTLPPLAPGGRQTPFCAQGAE
ncbi:hypothetical protein [Candidatus Chlorohelix allophototropha]|uniref:hypothetical protein n=1 Tax=Candidatus Chlorohelix allophototropha TaxID=3003348 RepID=UPI003CE5A904